MRRIDPIRYVKLKASGRLPSPKGLALAIVRLMQKDDYKIEDLVRLVQSDPAIAGELLRFSNAASFGRSRPIVSLSEAIIALGTQSVRVIVMAFSVLHDHRKGHCAQFNYEQFWARSLATAIAAQALASFAKINAEEIFTAGLLCNLGELAMASIFPDRYAEIITLSKDNAVRRVELELEAFGNDHNELNATLLLEWGLPEVLVTAIYHSEYPDAAGFQEGSRIYGLTLTLHLALAIADICVADDKTRWLILPSLFAKAARLGISTEEMNAMADGITASWLEWGKLLKIQTREITSFAELLASSPPRELLSETNLCPWPDNKNLLLICSDSALSSAITVHLTALGCSVKYASNFTDGLRLAFEIKPELVMIEMFGSAVNGADLCKALRDNSVLQTIYIFFLCKHEDQLLLEQAVEMGADDILIFPVIPLMLQTKLREALKIIQLQNELIKERNGLVMSAGEWARSNRRLTYVAMTDPLTQMSNRRYGLDTFSAEWVFARTNHLPLSCLMIDIDHFKDINDRHGHKAGDAVLVILASLLKTDARSDDLVFRYGGEEFCVICPGATLEMAYVVAERIRLDVEKQLFKVGNSNISFTVSIGAAVMKPTHQDKEALIHDADSAMYRAKQSGRNRVC